VFVATGDLAAQGIVASLARPAGNATGFTSFDYSLIGKLLEILKDIAPKVARVGLVFHPDNIPAWTHFRTLETAAQSFAVTPVPVTVRDPPDIERAIGAFAGEANGGLILPPDVSTITHRQLIIGLAGHYQLPAIYAYAFFVRGGGLISYGPDQVELYRRAAGYVDRIYRGENPGDLPVQQPTKFELAINLRTAKALNVSVPPALLARADEVIE
jgi:putative tryptophan/tyrosine transport system substrate-binding protein